MDNESKSTPELLDELLRIATAITQGIVPEYQSNALFTAGAFDLLIVTVRGDEAFDLLFQLCQRYHSVKPSGTALKGFFYLLSLLAPQTGTSEMPLGLNAIISEHRDLSRSLMEWYQIQQ